MAIKKIESYIVSTKLSESFYFSQFQYDERTICLVKITTDDGIHGWGEGYGPAHIIKSSVEFFSSLLVGKDPLQHENLWQALYLRSMDHARRGIMLSALSAIDIALWDLKGKLLNQPVSVLLGGRKRNQVKAYATGMYFSAGKNLAERLAEEALSYKEQGFTAMKMKVGLGVDEDVRNVRAVRNALGPDTELMIDANHAFSLREALQLIQKLQQFNIAWFEEPLSPDDYDGYHELKLRSGIPIAAGECEYLRSGFLQLFQKRCVDIVQPDVCGAGGITETKKICSFAQTFGVEYAPHCWGTGIALCAALHLLSNWDMVPGRLLMPEPVLEYDRTENRLREELGTPPVSVMDGIIKVPETPGLGIDIDENILKKFALNK